MQVFLNAVPPMGLGRGDTKHCKGSLENFLVLKRCTRIGVSFRNWHT
jgi:hypothetical protein